MAKYRRYRKYSRRSHPKWASNIQEIGTTSVVSQGPGANYYSMVLAFNPLQTNTAVSQIYTVKNMEVTFYTDLISNQLPNATEIEDITAYIMFVPQGMNVTTTYNLEHPEYIMAYKFIGQPCQDTSTSLAQPAKVRTRLSRRLNTGDSIIMFLKYNDTRTSTSNTPSFYFHGIARWNTKAN